MLLPCLREPVGHNSLSFMYLITSRGRHCIVGLILLSISSNCVLKYSVLIFKKLYFVLGLILLSISSNCVLKYSVLIFKKVLFFYYPIDTFRN